jgi:cysteine-rich repeat protein
MNLKKLISGIFISLLIVNLALADSSTSFTIDLSRVNSGGNLASSGSFRLNDAFIGTVDGNFANSPSYKMGSGLIYLEQLCGNNILEFGETCDDGNLTSGDGCSSTCVIEGICGNGIIEPGETCDDSNTVSGDGCSSTCQIEVVSVCGNGVLEAGEQCDDGNNTNGDGCSAICTIEVAPPPPPPGGGGGLIALCGNNKIDPGEQCDDGNKITGDGCDQYCRTEVVYKKFKIKARPEKRVNPQNNWGLSSQIRFYSQSKKQVIYTATVQINNVGWGEITIPDLPDGNYDISIKGRSHLTKIIRNTQITGTATFTLDFTFGETFYLLAGDVHESKDDFVNALDITATVHALYTADLDADLNRDDMVNALDIAITVNNLYKNGESF